MAHNKERRKQKSHSDKSQQATPSDRENADFTPRGLPELLDFMDAGIEDVILGPRSEMTLVLSPLIWVGGHGHHGSPLHVRFGGIFNYAEVEAGIAEGHHLRSEIGYLRYGINHNSKPGDIHVHLEFERVEARIMIHCRRLTVTDIDQPET